MTSINENAPIAKESNEGGNDKHQVLTDSNIKPFAGTNNPAELRAIRALVMTNRPISRREIDAACGVSNGPEVIRKLRAKGLPIKMEMVGVKNRFGKPVQAGFYSLTEMCRVKLLLWIQNEAKEMRK